MKSTVERLSPTRVRINVEVPFDELKPDFDRAYKKIAKQAKIPGFRPGKAPARILEARLGRDAVLNEVVNGAIPGKYSEAINAAEEVTPIGRPDIEVTEIADGDKLMFTAEVDVRPDLTLPDLDSLTVTVDNAEVTDEHVNAELETLRTRFGTLAGVERAAAKDDFLLIDLAASVDGVPLEEAQTSGLSYQLGQGGVIDGLDEAVDGLAAGESATFTTRLVAGEHADSDAEVTVTVTAVKERTLPAADDEFAQLASEFDTLDELTADLHERLGRMRAVEQVTQARDRVLDALINGTDVPLPESVVAAEVDQAVHNAVQGMGHDEDKFAAYLASTGQTQEGFKAATREEAERSVRTRLMLDALADAQHVSVDDKELTERLVLQAKQYQMPPEEFVRRVQEAGQLGAIYAEIRRSKALMTALRAVTVTDESGAVVDLSDLLGPADGAEDSDDTVDDAGTDAPAEPVAAQAPAGGSTT
ncbi:MAG: trigger factor [Pseudonocardia sp.]